MTNQVECKLLVSENTYKSIKDTSNGSTILDVLKGDPLLMIYVNNQYYNIPDNQRYKMKVKYDKNNRNNPIAILINGIVIEGNTLSFDIDLQNICPLPEIKDKGGLKSVVEKEVNEECTQKPYRMNISYYYN